MNILRFQTNVPNEVVLESPQGVVVEGRYGERMMFHLTDGRVMYVPRIVATKIEAEGLAAGERFELCRTNVKNGRHRSIEWTLKRVDAETSENLDPPESALEHDLRRSLDAVKGQNPIQDPSPDPSTDPTALPATRQSLHAPPRPATPRPPAEPPTSNPNGNGSTPVAQPNGSTPVAVQSGRTESVPVAKLEHAFKTAISAAHNAEKYGAELGYVVRFDADAIKSMAITVLINMSQAVRR